MALGDFTPIERRNEYYATIQLGKDVKTQTELISQSTNAMIATQIASSNAIIASQERIKEGIDEISYGIDRVEQGIYGLQAAFEWGISEVVWQIEQNRRELRNILEVLSAPLDTQAKELRKRAEEAYAYGWFEEALEDFLQSEKKNRYDFSIHISIGMIYLFKKNDKAIALEYFDKAIKYATPKSKYYTSFALLHKSHIKSYLGLLEEAEAIVTQAVELSPDFAEALYQCAQHNALLNRPDKSLQMLNRAIKIDVNYCEKACNDNAFDQIRPKIIVLFEHIRKTEGDKVRNNWIILSKRLENFNTLTGKMNCLLKAKDGGLHKCVNRIMVLMKRNSYRDYLEATPLIEKSLSNISSLRGDMLNQLNSMINSHKTSIDKINNNKTKKNRDTGADMFAWIMMVGGILSACLGLRGCWIRGTGPGDFSSILWAVWSLIWIPTIGLSISYGIYFFAKSITTESINNRGVAEITQIQLKIDELNGFVKRLSGL